MSFLGADGKRYYKFRDSKRHGTLNRGHELHKAIERRHIFQLKPIVSIIRKTMI